MTLIRLIFLFFCLTALLNGVEFKELKPTDSQEQRISKERLIASFFIPFTNEETQDHAIHLTHEQFTEIVVLSIFIGTFLSLFIYNGFLYLSTKQSDYLLYVLYILFLNAWIFSCHGYFIYYHEITSIVKTLFILGTLLFLTLFSRKFLTIDNFFNRISLVTFIALSILIFFLMITAPDLGEYFSELILIALSTLYLYFAILSYKNDYTPSKYYIVALLGYIIGSITIFLMLLGVILPNFYTLHAQFIGSMWSMIFLSLALGYKVSLLHIKHNETLFKAQVQEKMLFLQSRQAIIGELIGNIAHQWKEPLAEVGAIQTNLQANILIKGTLSQEKILDSTQKSSNIIRHLADTIDIFYRFFTHQKSKKGEFYVLNEIRNIQKMVHYSLKVENITLEIHPAHNILAYGDNNEFANALLNIILNAKDILVERKIENPTIIIHVRQNNNAIIITIEDNAGGITQEPIHKIFDSCISSKADNIGIGLYLTKTIIEKRLRGKITVENSSKGALFTIMLPLVWELIEVEESSTSFNIEESTLQRLSTLERQVEKQEEIEKVIRQWEDIFNQTHWGVSVHKGTNNHFEMINPAFCAMYGYSEQELKQMNVYDLFSPASLDILTQKQQEAFEKSFTSFEAIHVKKDGTKFPVTIDLTVIKNEYDEILYHIANVRDISEQKKDNQRLLLKKFALNHIHEAVYLMNEKGEFKYVNESACKTLGYSESELLQLNIGDVDADWPVERWPEHWEVIKEIKTMTMELRHKRKDGTIFPVEVLANYFEYEGVAYNMGLARDISERKAIQENLLLKEFALNKISEAVYLIDEKSNFYYFNEAACQELGYEEDELMQLSVIEIDPDMSKEKWAEHWNDIKKHRASPLLSHHQRKDGSIFPIEVSANYFEYKGVAYNLAVIQNITERLEVEKRKDDEKMRLFFERQLVGMAITSPEKGWLHTNKKLQEMFGYTHEELTKLTWAELTHPEDLAYDVEQFEKLLAGEIEEYMLEKRFIRKDQTLVYTNLAVSCVRNENRSVNYALALLEDITEQKKMEATLKDANDRYIQILDNSIDVIYLLEVTLEGHFVYVDVNAAYEEVTGISRDIVIGLDVEDIENEIFRTILIDKFTTCLNAGEKTDYTADYPFPSGLRTFHSVLLPIRDENGRIIRIVGAARDITEQKKLEALLEKERKFLTDAQRVAHTGSWYLDLENNLLSWSDESYRIFEFDKENIENLHKSFYECVHPDDREMVNAPYLESLKTGIPYQVEHRIVMNDGRIKHIIERCEHVYDKDGKPLYSLGTVQDITERKKIEKELVDSHNFLNHLIDSIPDPIFVKDREHKWLLLNEMFCALVGLSKENLLGKSDYDIFPKEEANVFWEKDEVVFNSNEVNVNEEYFTSQDGVTHCIETVKSMFISSDSKEYLVGSIRDITERKAIQKRVELLNEKLEELVLERTAELAKKEREFRTIAENMPNFLSRYDKEGNRIYVNPSLCNYFGVSSDELVGFSPQKKPLIGVPTQLHEKIMYVLQTGHKTHMEIVDVKEGKKQCWTLIFAPEFDEKGNIDGVISIGHDITYIKQSEEQLQLLKTAINNASDALYIVGDDRSIHYVSDASCRMLGYTYDEFLTMKVEDIDPCMKVEEIDNVRERVNEFTTTTFHTNHRTKDGKILDVEITVTKFIFNDTDLRLSIVKDITQQIRYEQEIKELNKNLEHKVSERTKELQKVVEFNKSIIQAIPDMLFEVSKEGIYLNIWARDEKLLAAQKELLLGKNFKDMLPPDAVDVSIKTMKEVDIYGSSLGNTYKLELQDGEYWFELHTTKKEPDGNYLALVRDVTDRKKAQNELLTLNATLEEKVKERTYELQKALEWSEEIINTLPDILFEMDKRGDYLGVWTQNKELLAQQKETLLGNNIYNVLSKESANTIIKALEEANTKKFSSGKKISINLPQGNREFELSISKKSDGNYLILSRDITQRK